MTNYTYNTSKNCIVLPIKENTLTLSLYTQKFKRNLKQYYHSSYGPQDEIQRLISLVTLICKVEGYPLSTFSNTAPEKELQCLFDRPRYKESEKITIQDICASTGLYQNYYSFYLKRLNDLKKLDKKPVKIKKVIKKYSSETGSNFREQEQLEKIEENTEVGDLNKFKQLVLREVNKFISMSLTLQKTIDKQCLDEFINSVFSNFLEGESKEIYSVVLSQTLSRYWSQITGVLGYVSTRKEKKRRRNKKYGKYKRIGRVLYK